MSQSNEKYQKGFLIFFIVTIIVVLIVVFILRATASKSGSYLTTLTSTEQQAQGYGTYKVVNTSPCFTANGKCSGTGTQLITEYCVANPDTGYGCIDENGQQTFAPRTTQQNCLPNCRATILKEQTNTYLNTCNYESPFGDLTSIFTLYTLPVFAPNVTTTSNSVTLKVEASNEVLAANTNQTYTNPYLSFLIPISLTSPPSHTRSVLLVNQEGLNTGFTFKSDGTFVLSINNVPQPSSYTYSTTDTFSIRIVNNIMTVVQNNEIIYTNNVSGTSFKAAFYLWQQYDTITDIAFGNIGSTALCIPRTAKTYNYKVFNCVTNDGIGENACSYVCGADGKNGANISGDSIVDSPSYIPACVGSYGKTITLNSLAGVNLTALPKQGYKISKGYLVKNKIDDLTGNIVPNMFTITPDYYPPPTANLPIPFGLSEITRDQLTTLDSSLLVYQNCAMPTERVKPYCANYFFYQPTDVTSQITLIDKNVNTDSTSNFVFSKDCFNNPFWNDNIPPDPLYKKYINPYNTTTKKYTLKGIGGYGLTFENYVCQFTPGNLEQVPGTGIPLPNNPNPPQYYIPGALGGPNETNYCVPFTSSLVDPPASNTNCYNSLESITMPLAQNKIYNICDVTYPDGSHPNDWQAGEDGSAKIKTPGLIQVCQYLPQNSDLDFVSSYGIGGSTLNVNLQQFFGNFTQLSLTSSGKTYFLGTRTSPCDSTVNSNSLSPLTNCSYIKPVGANGFSIENAVFIYNGGDATVSEAGNYWNKPGCDSEMIELTSSLNIIFSLREASVINAPVGTKQTINDVNMYAYFGNIFGILLEINPGGGLLFQPILQGDTTKSKYTPTPTPPPSYFLNENFNLEFDYTNPNDITLKIISPTTIVDSFDGNIYIANNFNVSTLSMKTRVIPYNEYKKKSGLYVDQDVTVAAVFQRNFACYTTTCDPQTATFPCFPKTCNLYYDYNADKC